MNWTWKGRVWRFGDDVPNDDGIMFNSDFAAKARPQDLVVAGRNYACGDPRMRGFLGLNALGVGVLAESMSRAPMRACINAGVPVMVIPGLSGFARAGDALVVDWVLGLAGNSTTGMLIRGEPMAEVMREIVACGGGIGYMKKRLALAA